MLDITILEWLINQLLRGYHSVVLLWSKRSSDGLEKVHWISVGTMVAENLRHQLSHVLTMGQSRKQLLRNERMLKDGYRQDVAGAAWFQYQSLEKTLPLEAIAFNHRPEAFYRADMASPNAPAMLFTKSSGVKGCKLFSAATPVYLIKVLANSPTGSKPCTSGERPLNTQTSLCCGVHLFFWLVNVDPPPVG